MQTDLYLPLVGEQKVAIPRAKDMADSFRPSYQRHWVSAVRLDSLLKC